MNAIVSWLSHAWLRQTVVWLASAACIVAAGWSLTDRPIEVELRLSSTAAGEGQLFYSRGLEFSEPRSMRFAMTHDGQVQRYVIRLNGSRPPRWLRLDPARAPGEIVLEAVRFTSGSRSLQLDGTKLAETIELLQDIEVDAATSLHLISTGPDPALRLLVPPEIRISPPERLAMAAALLLTAAVLVAFAACAALAALRAGRRLSQAGVVAVLLAGGFVLVLSATGIEPAFRPIQALRYGTPLFFGALCFAVIGAALDRRREPGASRLFLWLLLGQAVTMLYLQLRSLLTMALGLPVTQLEMFALPGVAAWAIGRSSSAPDRGVSPPPWLYCQLVLLLAICLLVADRELPRLAMLSSDPDQHAFFALQLQRFGGLPWQQGAWGNQPLNYPGGTALLGAAWSWLSWTDSRNVITSLPWILYFSAALTISDAASERVPSLTRRAAISLAVVGILAAGLLFPLYRHFVHQEGLGRILAFGFLALLAAPWLIRPEPPLRFRFIASTLGVFAIAALNPISLAGCTVLLGAVTLWAILGRRRESVILLCLPLGLIPALGDPYYLSMLGGQRLGTGVALGEGFAQVELKDGVSAGLRTLVSAPQDQLAMALRLLPSAGWAAWLVPTLLSISVLATASARRHLPWQAVTAILAAIVVVAATNTIATQFTTDPRLYLLAAYVDTSFAQLKLLCALVVASVALSTLAARNDRSHVRYSIWIVSAILVVATFVAGRSPQQWVLEPKWNYCGGLVCPHPDDVAVLEAFSRQLGRTTDQPRTDDRLLVLNAVRDLGRERWLIPIGGSRLAPFLDLPPSAFFYFQGNDAYTTDNYDQHVCRNFDRAWLTKQRVSYIFLPADRAHGCMSGADALIATEETVAHHGNAYLLRLRPALHPTKNADVLP